MLTGALCFVCAGNWSEDLSGSELLQRDEQPPTQAELVRVVVSICRHFSPVFAFLQRDHYSSVMRTTFKQVDPAYLRAQMDVKNLPRASSEVDKTMLFAHRGAGTDGISERTTYSDAWTPEAAGLQAAGSVPLSGAQLKRIAQKVLMCGRRGVRCLSSLCARLRACCCARVVVSARGCR